MSEQAQGETKWRIGELARVRVRHGHVSAVSPRRQQENGARPSTSSHDFDLRPKEYYRHMLGTG